MKILVAGGAGYVGSMLVPALLERNYDVTVIDLLWFGKYLPPDTNIIQKDLYSCTVKDLEGFDQVIFLAGLSNDPMAEYDPARNFIYNTSLPAYLAYLARSAGVKRFIYASSCSVYGYTVDECYGEEDPTVCSFPYGISKLQGEKGVMQMETETFSVISLRKGTICGYSPRMRLDLVINTMVKNALAEGALTVHNPSLWRPILDIRDSVSAYIRAIQANESISGVFNIASGNYTIGHIGDSVQHEVQKIQPVKMTVGNWQDLRNYKVTWEKATRVLGFIPRYSLEDIINDLIGNSGKFIDHQNDKYYNIKVCKSLFPDPDAGLLIQAGEANAK